MKSNLWLFTFAAGAVVVAFGATPTGYSHWTAAEIQDRAKGLPAK